MVNRTEDISASASRQRFASSFAGKQSVVAVWTIIAALVIQQSAIARISISPARASNNHASIPREAGSVFIDAQSGTKIVRVTDSRDGQARLASRFDSSTFNLDSSRFFVDLDGAPTLYAFDPSSLAIQKQGLLFGSVPLQFDSCHWSADEADTIFGLGSVDSARLYAYDTRSGSSTLLKDFSGIVPNGEAKNLSKSWSDDNHLAFMLRESGSAWRFGVVWDRASDRVYLFDATDPMAGKTGLNDARLDRSGEALILEGDTTTVWRYRTQQQSEAVQLESTGDSGGMKATANPADAFDLAGSGRPRNFPTNDISRDGRFSIFPSQTDDSRTDMFIAAVKISATASSVNWTNMVNCSAAANSLQKTGGSDQADDAYATSTQGVLSGDAYVEFTARETDKERWCGLNNSNAIHGSSSDINFAIKLGNNKKANVVENGIIKAKVKYKPGNVLRVAVESGVVNYYKNGDVFYTSTATPTYPLLVNASLVDNMAAVSDVMISLLNIGSVMSISPAKATIPTGGTLQFTALITGVKDTITWSATGGSVTDTGLYTAPATAGTYRVTAACTSNSRISASATVSVSTSTDATPPVISAVTASNITTNGATISWNTNELSDTQIEYGPTTGYGAMSTLNTALVMNHSVSFGGLVSGTVYHYKVRSRDAAGNLAVSGDQTFTTPAAGDATAPVISSVAASNVSTNTATLVWNTNEASDTQVDYGTTTGYGSSTSLNSSMVTSHNATLGNLSSNTLYHYRVRSRDAAGNLGLSGDFTFTTAQVSDGGGGVAVKTDYGVYPPPPAPSLPAAGGTFVDPTFGTTIMRLTDGSDGAFNATSYSYWPSFNKDSTRLWILNGSGAMLYSFDPVNFRASNKRLLFSSLPNGHFPDFNDATWSGSDRDVIFCHDGLRIYSYNVVSQAYTLIKDLASDLPPGQLWQMSMSRDDNTFGFTVKNTNGNDTGYVAWRRSQNSVYKNINMPGLDEVQVDKSGQYLIVKTGATGEGVVEVQVINLATGSVANLMDGQPDYAPGHSDVGNGFVIGGDNWNNRLTYRNTATPHTLYTVFDFPDWTVGAHVSMLADDENWILMSTFLANTLNSTGKFRDELFQIATDGSKRVRRLAHLHSVYRDYWDQPRANISRDGRFAVFTSNWGAADRRDVFIVKVPPPGGGGGGGGTSLVISSTSSSNVSATGATVTWNTNIASDSQVEYGTTSNYGFSTAVNTSLVSSHSVTLSGLTASTTYHYRAKSKDAQGNTVVSGDMTFTTTAGGGGGGGGSRQVVNWSSIVNCAVNGGSIQKSAGHSDGTFDAGGISQQSIVSGDGYLEFTAGETNTSRFCGLARNPSSTDYAAIDFGFQLNASGVAEVRENFVYKAETNYSNGDVFRVAIVGGAVKYYKNGVLLYASSRAPSYPLRAAATFTNLGSTINNAALASTSGGSLAFNPGSSLLNFGDVTVAALSSGDDWRRRFVVRKGVRISVDPSS